MSRVLPIFYCSFAAQSLFQQGRKCSNCVICGKRWLKLYLELCMPSCAFHSSLLVLYNSYTFSCVWLCLHSYATRWLTWIIWYLINMIFLLQNIYNKDFFLNYTMVQIIDYAIATTTCFLLKGPVWLSSDFDEILPSC